MSGLDDVLERLVNEPAFRDELYDDPATALAAYELSADDLEVLATSVDGDAGEVGVETRHSKSTLTAMFSELFGLFGSQSAGTGGPEAFGGQVKAGGDGFVPGTAGVGSTHDASGLLGMLDDVEPGGGSGGGGAGADGFMTLEPDAGGMTDLFAHQGGSGGGDQGGMIDLFSEPAPGGSGGGGGGTDDAGGLLGALDEAGGGGSDDPGGIIGDTGDVLAPDDPGGGGGGGSDLPPDGAGGGGEPVPYIYTPGEGGGGGLGGGGTSDLPVDPSDPNIGDPTQLPAVQTTDGEVPAVQLTGDELVGDPGAVNPPEPDLVADL